MRPGETQLMTKLEDSNRPAVDAGALGRPASPSSEQPAVSRPSCASILRPHPLQVLFVLALMCGALRARCAEPAILSRNDFSQAEIGRLPEGMLVLNGGFAVREEGENRFVELPGTPLDGYDVLFGPAGEQDAD